MTIARCLENTFVETVNAFGDQFIDSSQCGLILFYSTVCCCMAFIVHFTILAAEKQEQGSLTKS